MAGTGAKRMKPTVYVETSVISYLTAWPSRDVIVAGHQETTKQWWSTCRERFELMASELVRQEAEGGDLQAASERMEVLHTITLIALTDEARALARRLIESGALPAIAAADALHVAAAANYLVTWNCRHLANAAIRNQIEKVIRAAGYDPPIICTPEQLLED